MDSKLIVSLLLVFSRCLCIAQVNLYLLALISHSVDLALGSKRPVFKVIHTLSERIHLLLLLIIVILQLFILLPKRFYGLLQSLVLFFKHVGFLKVNFKRPIELFLCKHGFIKL
jgi:hypothetical protein